MSAEPGRTSRFGTGFFVAGVAVAVAAVALASFAIGRWGTEAFQAPDTTSAEAGFARDMQEHHLQAVEMSFLIRDATDDPDLRLLAYDIANSQAHQAGQMYGWLAEWGLPQTRPEPSMTWMARPALGDGHDHDDEHGDHTPGEAMPGMATRAQLAELAAAEGIEAERMFLELMIDHHLGGVEMAEALLARSSHRVVTDLAGSIVAAQETEIAYMEELLRAR